MEQNNFEKQVQQKMDEWKILPSESSWLNIEKRIQKRERNKRIIFMLFISALFFLTGGYWLLNSDKNINTENDQQIGHVIKKETEILTAKKKDSFGKPVISNKNRRNLNENNIPKSLNSLHEKSSKNLKQATLVNKKPSEVFYEKRLKLDIINEDSSDRKINKNPKLENGSYLKNKQNIFEDENKNFANKEVKTKAESENLNLENIDQKNSEEVNNLLKVNEICSIPLDKNPNLSKNKKQKSNWLLGITFSGGKSFLTNEFLDLNIEDKSYQSAPDPGTGSGSYSGLPLPVKTRNSAGFFGGVFLEKNISEKNKISLGINYKYFSTINKTGSKIDSSVQAYNSITYSKSYQNNFNYLELPLSFKIQLTNSQSLPVYWLAGINISQLISSNALQFQNNSGVYYNDNSLFNKTQIGFSTGFFATFFSKQKKSVNIGPYFYYNASRLANEGLYNKKHFNYIGISTEILLNKK